MGFIIISILAIDLKRRSPQGHSWNGQSLPEIITVHRSIRCRRSSIVLEIELAGARQVAKIFPAAVRIFILPPDLATLEARIHDRGTDSPEAIEQRLAQALVEIAAQNEFDYQIINDDLDTALDELDRLVTNAV
jgi:guanylate kinase